MPHENQDEHIDKELDLKKVWEMTPEQIEAWKKAWRKQDKKLAKRWRPMEH